MRSEAMGRGDGTTQMTIVLILTAHGEVIGIDPARAEVGKGTGRASISSPALTSRRLLWPTRA